jgi:hypothetical protein
MISSVKAPGLVDVPIKIVGAPAGWPRRADPAEFGILPPAAHLGWVARVTPRQFGAQARRVAGDQAYRSTGRTGCSLTALSHVGHRREQLVSDAGPGGPAPKIINAGRTACAGGPDQPARREIDRAGALISSLKVSSRSR